MNTRVSAATKLQGSLGIICSTLYAGLLSHETMDVVDAGLADLSELFRHPLLPVYLGFAVASLASLRQGIMRAALPIGFLALTPIVSWESGNAFFGLGFSVVATILLARSGFFFRSPGLRAALLGAALTAAQLATAIGSRRPLATAAVCLASGGVFCLFLRGVIQGGILASLTFMKEVVFLRDRGLSFREHDFVLARVAGKHPKVIAAENHVAVSTVRSTLSTATRKLGL
ncbi:MAG TPA: hypothetical protein VFL04_08585, partial [Rectinemataceae bacterium]|nr:hypothetical protein [Rectinemataceae bacterium]